MGATLRDYFAAHADVSVYAPLETFESVRGRRPTIGELAAYIAEIRVLEAEAMLAAYKVPVTGAGWIEWAGGECPVPEGAMVDVKHRDGEIYTSLIVGEDQECSDWSLDPDYRDPGDIVAYRIVAAAPSDGWIEWAGGNCPVPPRTRVEIKYPDDSTDVGEAFKYRWDWKFGGLDGGLDGGDIVAYRIVMP